MQPSRSVILHHYTEVLTAVALLILLRTNKKITMQKLFLIALIALGGLSIVACNDEDETPAADTRFEQEFVGADEMEILIDTKTNLVWVNDIRGCFAGVVTPMTQCEMLTFAGRSDWRTPTVAEMSELLKEIAAREMNLNYINAACGLMSTSEMTWVFTENTDMPGETTTATPGNAGLRCVANN
jgi:hypothetical protein